MSDAFDPYRKWLGKWLDEWLGIPPNRRPDHAVHHGRHRVRVDDVSDCGRHPTNWVRPHRVLAERHAAVGGPVVAYGSRLLWERGRKRLSFRFIEIARPETNAAWTGCRRRLAACCGLGLSGLRSTAAASDALAASSQPGRAKSPGQSVVRRHDSETRLAGLSIRIAVSLIRGITETPIGTGPSR